MLQCCKPFHSSVELTLLSDAEQASYQKLKQQTFGQNIRLEQERIDWGYAMQQILGSV